MSTTTVKRIAAPSGNRDNDYLRPECFTCGWRGALYSNRTVEGRTLADRHASVHRCHQDLTRALIREIADTLDVTLDSIRTQINDFGLTDYVVTSGGCRVVIGAAYDPQDGTTHGFDFGLFEDTGESWDQIRQDWCDTPEAAVLTALGCLRAVDDTASDSHDVRCAGCGKLFTARGLRTHQSARYVSMACRPTKATA